MVVMRWSVADVLHPLSCLELVRPGLPSAFLRLRVRLWLTQVVHSRAQQPYRDAGYSRADYHLHPQHILYGVHRALQHQLLDLSTFDLAAYEAAEKVETGDWNWITPGFVAFASPVEAGWSAGGQTPKKGGAPGAKINRAFRNVLDEFESKGVKVVVRCVELSSVRRELARPSSRSSLLGDADPDASPCAQAQQEALRRRALYVAQHGARRDVLRRRHQPDARHVPPLHRPQRRRHLKRRRRRRALQGRSRAHGHAHRRLPHLQARLHRRRRCVQLFRSLPRARVSSLETTS